VVSYYLSLGKMNGDLEYLTNTNFLDALANVMSPTYLSVTPAVEESMPGDSAEMEDDGYFYYDTSRTEFLLENIPMVFQQVYTDTNVPWNEKMERY